MNIEDAIRSLGATNATPLFPEGNPDNPDFDIHAHLETMMDLLYIHLPLPPEPTDQSPAALAAHHRRVDTIERQRILTVKGKFTGFVRRLVKAEPDATFANMDTTLAWLIRKFE